MQITPNDVHSASEPGKTLDIKVAQLIKSLANTPMLLEKVVINQTQGVLLELIAQKTKINLQLPLKSTGFIQQHTNSNSSLNTSVGPKLTISLNNNQQVQLTLSSSGSSLPLAQVPNQVFSKATLLQENFLKLETPVSKPTNLQVNSVAPSLPPQKLGRNSLLTPSKGAEPAINGNLQNQRVAPLASVSLQLDGNKQINSVNTPSTNISDKPLDVSTVVKQFLKHSFTKHAPLSAHLSAIKSISDKLNQSIGLPQNFNSDNAIQQTAQPLVKALTNVTQQVQELLVNIKKPSFNNSVELSQRLKNSGNSFENKLVNFNNQTELKINLNQSETRTEQNTNNQLSNKQAILTNSQSSTQLPARNTPDLKLLLVQIKAHLEGVISQIKGNQTNSQNLVQSTAGTIPSSQSLTTHSLTTNREAILQSNISQSTSETQKLDASHAKVVSGTDALGKPESLLSNPSKSVRGQQQLIQWFQQNQIMRHSVELLSEVRNTLAQIESNQLLSLRSEQPNLHQFLVDLPFSNTGKIDSFELLFEHDKSDSSQNAKKHWKVIVRFDLEPLGPMFAQIELKNEKISSHIFAESQTTAKLINENLHVLKKSLLDAGVTTDSIKSNQGNIPNQLVPNSEHSVDFHA